ncbi:tetratricopeptide repeat protein [bacterium]|nr:tetratricopeptide repeat protein [candidate division CSSED10-310 bacterium]
MSKPEDPVYHLLETAKTLHSQGRTSEALDLLENAPQANDKPRILALSAHYLYLLRRFESARATAQRALERDPRNVLALGTMGEIAIKSKDYAGAETWFREILTGRSRSVYPFSRLAAIACELHDYDKAVDILHEGLDNHPGNSELLEQLQYSLTMSGRHADAKRARQIETVQPDEPGRAFRLLMHRFEQLTPEKAIEQLRILASMKHYEKEPLLFDRLAYYLELTGQYAYAIPHLQHVLDIQPRNDAVRVRLCEALVRSGDLVQAELILQSLEGYRRDVRIQIIRLNVMKASGNRQDAMNLCMVLLKENPRHKQLRQIFLELIRQGIRPTS